MSCVNRQRVAIPCASRESHPGMRGGLGRMWPAVHPDGTILFVRADVQPDILQLLRLTVALFPDSQVQRPAHNVGSDVNLALMLRHGNSRRAPGEAEGARPFGDRNTQEVRDRGVADAFLMRLRCPGAA